MTRIMLPFQVASSGKMQFESMNNETEVECADREILNGLRFTSLLSQDSARAPNKL